MAENPYYRSTATQEGDPLKQEQATFLPKCPKCGSSNFTGRGTQWEIIRICKDCGTEWSGGMSPVGAPDKIPSIPPDIIAQLSDIDDPNYFPRG